MQARLKEKLYYFKYAMFHPFDAFYEIRFRHKGSTILAVILLFLFGVTQCVSYQYTGFVMNTNPISEMNSLTIFASWVFGIVLFTASNWTVTTLLNGKGALFDILQVVSYSLTPVTLTMLIRTFLSNFIIEEEIMIVQVIVGIGIVWCAFMLVAGLCVIHEYSFGKNIASMLLTIVAAAIILFLGILFFTLVEQMVTFVISVAEEIMRRL